MGALGCIGRAPTDSTEVFSSNISNMSSTNSINETVSCFTCKQSSFAQQTCFGKPASVKTLRLA